ncbi:MAG: oxygen-dependent coproporphyrinogen oxidase [Cytophagales bacterium]
MENILGKEQIKSWFEGLQDRICAAIEVTDGKAKFQQDVWQHHDEGGGRTRLIQNGNILAKAGVNFSAVGGKTPDKILEALKLENANFFATGVSIVMHPINPFVPIIHMNVRYFEMTNGVYWFGGGIDLTPHYVNEADAQFFHQTLKNACDKHDLNYYPKFKTWADDYFFIKHRNETRGIGGIFFDHLKEDESHSKADIWAFVQEIGDTFIKIYPYLMTKNASHHYDGAHLKWQNMRRGRYVEFNLVYDKGTKFGLDTNGRTESILMSMPPLAAWEYDFVPEIDSPESKTLDLLKKGVDWA